MDRWDACRIFLDSKLVVGASKTLSQSALAQAVRIGELAQLKEVWADLEFQFASQPCLLVRVPAPQPDNPRFPKASERVYLTAYSRICPTSPVRCPYPTERRILSAVATVAASRRIVRCWAAPPTGPLAIRLEVREGAV